MTGATESSRTTALQHLLLALLYSSAEAGLSSTKSRALPQESEKFMLIADFSFLKRDRKYKERGKEGKQTKKQTPQYHLKGFYLSANTQHKCQDTSRAMKSHTVEPLSLSRNICKLQKQ